MLIFLCFLRVLINNSYFEVKFQDLSVAGQKLLLVVPENIEEKLGIRKIRLSHTHYSKFLKSVMLYV